VVVPYTTARDMAEDAPKDLWDICFLGHDPGRAHLLAWSRPYLEIAAVYAGRAPLSPIDPAQVDQPGTTILSARGAAYDLHLARRVRHATLIRADSFTEAVARFREGEGDLVAGVRESLARAFGGDPAFALMQTPFATVGQAIAVPLAQAGLVAALDLWLQDQPAQ
ncbi:MAG: transporter substrate-binding domain-containing protein, partial [Paracoccaceae bacterium]|nr:transporter substrate-binding domain-containing protein [Paracoccaceae bacterium]